jgi:hypothetical protein
MKYSILVLFIAFASISYGQTKILDETFESGIPSSWKVVNQDGLTPENAVSEYTQAWISVTDPFDTSATVNHCASSTSYFTTTGNANRWLITPSLSLANYGNVLRFKAASFDPSFPDNYAIKIGTDTADLSTFETLVTYIAEAPYWSEHLLNLDTLGHNNQSIFIAFVLNSDNGFKLFLDDINFTIEDPLATENLALNTLQIYPNPTSDFLNFNLVGEKVIKEIYTLDGKKITQSIDNKIDVRDLKAGVYVVKIAGFSRLLKFVKE